MNLWVVVPTYNERENIDQLLARCFALPLELTVLVVDDSSPDGTAERVGELKAVYPRLRLFKRAGKLGLGSAYRDGFSIALQNGGEILGEMDADMSHAPEDLLKLISAVKEGADVVIGSRRVKGGRVDGWGLVRRFTSWGAMTTARLALGLKTLDVTAGFRLYTRQALEKIPWQAAKSDGYAWQEEMLYLCEKAGLRIVEVPVVFVDRKHGKSKLNSKNIFEFFKTMWRLR